MKYFRWASDKNETLQSARGVSSENVVVAVEVDHFFLKLVIPTRKATRDYLKQGG